MIYFSLTHIGEGLGGFNKRTLVQSLNSIKRVKLPCAFMNSQKSSNKSEQLVFGLCK